MSEHTQHNKPALFSSRLFILLLIVIIGLFGWYTYSMRQQLDQLQDQYRSIQSQVQSSDKTPSLAPSLHSSAPASPDGQARSSEVTDNTVAETTDDKLVEHDRVDDKTAASVDESTAMQNAPQERRQGAPETALTWQKQQPSTRQRSVPPRLIPPQRPYNDPFYDPYPYQQLDPYEEIRRMQEYMDRVFQDRFQVFDQQAFQHHFRQDMSIPQIDIREQQDRYIVRVKVPGAEDEKDISVTLDGQRLSIRGNQVYEKQTKDQGGNIVFSERRSGRFHRSVELYAPVDESGMRTKFEDGILKIMIPKR